jgi:hypothetical protein
MNLSGQYCPHRQPPRAGAECLAAIWTQGRSCRACWVVCYRQGWSAQQATRDNAQLVRETIAQPVPEETP